MNIIFVVLFLLIYSLFSYWLGGNGGLIWSAIFTLALGVFVFVSKAKTLKDLYVEFKANLFALFGAVSAVAFFLFIIFVEEGAQTSALVFSVIAPAGILILYLWFRFLSKLRNKFF